MTVEYQVSAPTRVTTATECPRFAYMWRATCPRSLSAKRFPAWHGTAGAPRHAHMRQVQPSSCDRRGAAAGARAVSETRTQSAPTANNATLWCERRSQQSEIALIPRRCSLKAGSESGDRHTADGGGPAGFALATRSLVRMVCACVRVRVRTQRQDAARRCGEAARGAKGAHILRVDAEFGWAVARSGGVGAQVSGRGLAQVSNEARRVVTVLDECARTDLCAAHQRGLAHTAATGCPAAAAGTSGFLRSF